MAKILVVDDDDVARKNMERLLKHRGFDVTSAYSATNAIEIIKVNNFDVVVSDLVMENDKAGLDVLDAAKEKNESTEVIIITAYGKVPTAFDSSKRGAFAYIEKDDENPYDLLYAKVEEALENIRNLRAEILKPKEETFNIQINIPITVSARAESDKRTVYVGGSVNNATVGSGDNNKT